jgi:pSer/pThr/pTyr-binding forkhead associated (FHA) protein
VRDLGSKNGVFQDGLRVRQASLSSGERFLLGLTEITIQY